MSNAVEKQPIPIYLYKAAKCATCLHINPKGEKHYPCHKTIPDRNGRTNPECPAGDYVIVDGFRVELWAQRYAKAQLTGHLKNMRVIQTKLEGLDEETVQQFWQQVNLNVAIAMGATLAEEVTDGDEGDDGAEGGEQDEGNGEGASLRLVGQPQDGGAEEEATEDAGEEAADDAAEGQAPAAGATEDDDWED